MSKPGWTPWYGSKADDYRSKQAVPDPVLKQLEAYAKEDIDTVKRDWHAVVRIDQRALAVKDTAVTITSTVDHMTREIILHMKADLLLVGSKESVEEFRERIEGEQAVAAITAEAERFKAERAESNRKAQAAVLEMVVARRVAVELWRQFCGMWGVIGEAVRRTPKRYPRRILMEKP